MRGGKKASKGFSNGFVLLEIVIGMLVLSVVLIVSAKMLLNIQKDNVMSSIKLSFALEANNTLDAIRAYLLEAKKDSISYGEGFISWESDLIDVKSTEDLSNAPTQTFHRIFLKGDGLYLDGFLMIDGLSDFQISPYEGGLRLKICPKATPKTSCKQRWIPFFEA